MNPFRWRREHQIALLGAALIGAVIGTLLGVRSVDEYAHEGYHEVLGFYGWWDFYWAMVAIWAAAGAALAAGIVYVQRLLRT